MERFGSGASSGRLVTEALVGSDEYARNNKELLIATDKNKDEMLRFEVTTRNKKLKRAGKRNDENVSGKHQLQCLERAGVNRGLQWLLRTSKTTLSKSKNDKSQEEK